MVSGMSENTDTEGRTRKKQNWLLLVGGLLFAWAVVGAISNDGTLPAIGWLVALLGVALIVVGLLRHPR